jgi:osmotically inducible protein OsmC
MKRNATAVWQGGKDGQGNLTTQTKVLSNTPYNFISRFGEGSQTNPEELIAAAHAGCFTMKLSINLETAGFTPENLETKCEITIDNGTITTSYLTLKAKVRDISKEKFDELVKDAENNCPVSKLLNAQIRVESTLNQ